jgi:hypothetical protein
VEGQSCAHALARFTMNIASLAVYVVVALLFGLLVLSLVLLI